MTRNILLLQDHELLLPAMEKKLNYCQYWSYRTVNSSAVKHDRVFTMHVQHR